MAQQLGVEKEQATHTRLGLVKPAIVVMMDALNIYFP
jgi:hypothetical protein